MYQRFLHLTYLMMRQWNSVYQRRFMLNSRIHFLKARTLNHMWLRLSPMRWKSGPLKKVPHIIHTGSSLWPILRLRSMMRSLIRRKTALFFFLSQEKSWSRVNRMVLHSLQVVSVQHVKQGGIQHGIVHHRLSFMKLRTAHRFFIFRLFSVLTQVKHWIRRHRFFVPWKHWAHRLCVLSNSLVIQQQQRL